MPAHPRPPKSASARYHRHSAFVSCLELLVFLSFVFISRIAVGPGAGVLKFGDGYEKQKTETLSCVGQK